LGAFTFSGGIVLLFRLVSLTALFALGSLAATPAAAFASPSGLAWDAVVKLVHSSDTASIAPGSFDSDYAAAAAYKPPKPPPGMPGFLKSKMPGGEMLQLVATGVATKHYVAGSKERVDSVALQTATITDCSARTITALDLSKKTYHVVSMDQPSGGSPSGGGPAPNPQATDDGTKIAIDVKNAALAPKQVGGLPTTGYQSDMTFTETRPAGDSNTQNLTVIAYYSTYAQPWLSCIRLSSPSQNEGMDIAGSFTRVMQAMALAGSDKRITVTQSGPRVPLGQLTMFDALTFKGQPGQAGAFVNERANVRPVDASDPAFSIPSGFTKV
jgi:hypothetical protein